MDGAAATPLPPLPQAFGRYTVTGAIGGGAMGMVYRAHDPAIDRPVAVKVMKADALEPAARQEYLDRFRVEVRAAGRCTHAAIVGVYDFGEQDGSPYIVMEYVEGQTLSAMLREAGTDRREVAPRLATAMLQVLDGLQAAHALGIIHRDIKPANILVTLEGRAKIADFGIARLEITALTAAGGMIGTPAYMAPEQALGRRVDQRADLFAASAILYEILLGRPPFAGASLPETLLRLTGSEPAEMGVLGSTPLGAVIARGLQKNPDLRHASAAELAAALRAAMAGAPVEEATLVVRPGLPGLAPTGSGGSAGSGGSRGFDAAMLQRMREDLARHIGPIAETLLRRAAAAAASEEDLIRACGQMIEDPAARAAFLRRHRGQGAAAPMNATGVRTAMPGTAVPASGFAIGPATEAKVVEALAFQLGPIARVLVRRAAGEAKTADSFVDMLIDRLPDAREGAPLRRKLQAIVAGG